MNTRTRLQTAWDVYANALAEYPVRANMVTSGVLCASGDAMSQYFEYHLGIMSPDKDSYNWQRTARMTVWGTFIGGPVLAMWYRTLHFSGEALSVSYAPIVSGRLASIAESTPALQWLTTFQKEVHNPISPMRILAGKVVIDTMLFQAPYLNLYFASISSLEGLSGQEILEKTRASFHRGVCARGPARRGRAVRAWRGAWCVLRACACARVCTGWVAKLHTSAIACGCSPLCACMHRLACVLAAWALSFMVWTPVQAINLYFVPWHFQPVIVAGVNVGWATLLSLLNHYHDYGSPRVVPAPLQAAEGTGEQSDSAGGVASRGVASRITQQKRQPLPPDVQRAWAAEQAAWELERSQLRTRIAQLLAENRSLRQQLGQIHAASFAVPTRGEQPTNAQQQSR